MGCVSSRNRCRQSALRFFSKSEDCFFQGRLVHPPASRVNDLSAPGIGLAGEPSDTLQTPFAVEDIKVGLMQGEKVEKEFKCIQAQVFGLLFTADQPVQAGQAGNEPRLGIVFRP
jgi:hypothetical protein